MRHHDHNPREVIQVVLQDLQRLDVQIVRGLVQDQHVGRLHQHPQQIQPPLLAARQLGDRRVLLALNEQKALAHRRRCDQPVRRPHVLAVVFHHFDHSPRIRQLLILLAKIADPNRLSPLHRARIRLKLSCQNLEQRRLPAPVRPDDPNSVILQESIREVPEQALIAVTLRKMTYLNRLVSHPGWKRLQKHIPLLGDLLPIPQSLEAPNVRLLLGRPGPRPAHHPRQILLVQRRHLPLRSQREVQPLLLGLQVLFIISRITVNVCPIDLPNRIRHLVQEITVMRNHHDRALITRQLLLQPLDHLMIQVVGRLIQDQNIGRRQQSRCQRCPLPLSA